MEYQFVIDYLIKNNINDLTLFSLQDDGEGVYIKTWGYSIDKPILPSKEECILYSAKRKKITQCQAYLQSTDWQIIRLSDPTSGESLKEGVAEKRALARSLQDEISSITIDGEYYDENNEPITPFQALENINVNFN